MHKPQKGNNLITGAIWDRHSVVNSSCLLRQGVKKRVCLVTAVSYFFITPTLYFDWKKIILMCNNNINFNCYSLQLVLSLNIKKKPFKFILIWKRSW